MANKFNPIGGKPLGNMITTTYSGKSNKYYIPASDTSDLWVNDFVKLVASSDDYGIPVIAKADPGDKLVGVVDGIKNIQETNSFIYRRGGEERFVYVVDDPWVELEMQVNGEILSTDIGQHADIIVGAGNQATGTSTTQIDLDTLSTDSAQIKIIGIVEKHGNEWGDFAHVRCFIAEHEYKDIPTYEENLWDRTGTTISPHTAGDDLNLGTGDIVATNAHFTGKLTVDGLIDPTALILDPQAVAPGTTDGTIYYDSGSTSFQFRENGSWITLGDTSVWGRTGTTITPDTAGDDLDMGTGDVTATDGTFTGDIGAVGGTFTGDVSANDVTATNDMYVTESILNPKNISFAGQASPISTADGSVYYDSGTSSFQFRENGAWVTLGDTSVWGRAGTTISPDNAGDDLDMGTGDITATDAHFTGKLTVDGLIDPTGLVLDAQGSAPVATDGTLYYDSGSASFQFRENGTWVSLGDTSVWEKAGTTISPETAGDDLDMGTGDITAADAHFTGKLTVDGLIDPTALILGPQGVAPITTPGTIYYDSGSSRFLFRESTSWITLGSSDLWDRTGTDLSPVTAGDNLVLGTGDVSGADATFTGNVDAATIGLTGDLTVAGAIINPTRTTFTAQGSAPVTTDGTIYYDSVSTKFQFRENGAWLTIGDTSVWDRAGTTISPETAGDDLDMGTGDITATDAHFTGKLTVDGAIDPTMLVLDAQGVAPGTDDGTIYYDSVSTNFQFRENGAWITLGDTSLWDRTGTTISPATAGDDLDMGTGRIDAAAGAFSGSVEIDGYIKNPTNVTFTAQASPPAINDGTIYYDSGSTNFQFRENGAWVTITTGASPFQRSVTTISPVNAGDDLDMGTGDITATDAHFTGKLTVDGAIDPTMLVLDAQGSAPGTADGTIYYDSGSTNFQFRENGSWVTLSDTSVWDRTGTTISPDTAGDDLDMGTGDITATDAHFTGKLTVDGLIDPTALVLDGQGSAPGTTDGTIYYDSTSTRFQFRENGSWVTLSDTSIWDRTATTISPDTAGDDLDMGTGDITATDAHFTGKLTVDGLIDPTALVLDAQGSAPGTDDGTIYYDSVSTKFQFRENGAWVSLSDASVWDRVGTTISPDTAGDDLDMGTGDITATDAHFTGKLTVDGAIDPTMLVLDAQAVAPGTDDGTIYYDSVSTTFQFRENGAWTTLGDTSVWGRAGTTISPDNAGDDLDMGTGDITATDAHFTGKLTVDGLIDPTALVLDAQGSAPGTDDGTLYYDSVSTKFQFRENGAWVTLGDTSVWERAGTTISPETAGDDLDLGTGNITATDAHFVGKLTVDGLIDPTALLLDPQGVAPSTAAGAIYYDSVSSRFLFREAAAWATLGSSDIWDRTGTDISPITAGDDLVMGTGNISGAAATFTGNIDTATAALTGDLTVAGAVNDPTNISFTAQGSAPVTNDGTIYYDSGSANFQFRENGAWVTLGDISVWGRAGTVISPATPGDDLDMGTGDITATDAHFTGKLTVDGLIDPTGLVLDAQGSAPGTDDGTIYYNSGTTNFQFRENGAWVTLGDTSVWDRAGTTISPDTAGDDLDMGTGDITATDAHFTGKLTVDGAIDPTMLVLDAQGSAPGTDDGTLYYDSVSTKFQFRENGAWVTLGDTNVWERTGTTLSPETAGDNLDMGTGDITATDAHFTGKLTVDGLIDPTALVLDAQGSAPGTDDGTIYYDSVSTRFQFRENGGWLTLGDTSVWGRAGTTISPDTAGDDLDMGTGDITATNAHFTGKLTVDGLIDPTALVLDAQGSAPGTDDGTLYYDSVSTKFQFRENGAWVTLGDTNVWERAGTTLSPETAGDDLDMGTGDITATDAHFTGKLTVDGLIDPTGLVLDAQGSAPISTDGTIYYDVVSTKFQFRENGVWTTLGDTSVWERAGTTISPETAGDDLNMGTGNILATGGTFTGNVGAVDGTFTGNISAVDGTFSGDIDVTGAIDNPTNLSFAAQGSAPVTTDGTIYYNNTSNDFKFRENGAWRDLTEAYAWAPDYFEGFVANRSAGDLNHDMEIDRGSARGVNNLSNMQIAKGSTLIKRIDANWAAGTNQGGFPSALTVSPNTWYHLFIIGKADGTTDAGYDTSLTAVNLLADATGYVDYRRITSIKTDGSNNILSHNQKLIGKVRRTLWDESAITTQSLDRSGAGQTTDTVTLNVPTGVYVKAFGEIAFTANAADDEASIFNVDQTALFGGRSQMMFVPSSPSLHGSSTYFAVHTNTSAQASVFQMGGATSIVRYTSRGWEE